MPDEKIEQLIDTAMSNIKSMVDVNTIVGDPVETMDGSIIIPISRVSFGFAAGGGEFKGASRNKEEGQPFAGGSGAGITLNPTAFLVVTSDEVRLLPVSNNAMVERLVNTAPEILKQIQKMMDNKKQY